MNSKSISSQPSQSFSLDEFAKALEQYDYQCARGKIVKGKVFQHLSEGAYVDIGGKSPGFVPLKEASVRQTINLAEVLPLEEEMEFLIISDQNEEGQVTLSRRQLEVKLAWDNVAKIAEAGSGVEMYVTGVNKGGVTGEVEGLRAFIPRSHLVEKINLESLVGQSLMANFIEVDPERQKLVLSQRQMARTAAMNTLQRGQLVDGVVVKMQPYGVFVDLNGVSGLLHIKQISGSQIQSLDNLFKVGQEIKVVITEIDEIKKRIALSTKILENYPGEILENMDAVMATADERMEQVKSKMDN